MKIPIELIRDSEEPNEPEYPEHLEHPDTEKYHLSILREETYKKTCQKTCISGEARSISWKQFLKKWG